MNSMPHVIHITCKNKDVLGIYNIFIESIVSNNENWNIILYDDSDITSFIEKNFPFLINIYKAFPTNIQRTDFFRLLVILKEGGIYMDADVFCFKSLNEIREHRIVFAVEKTLSIEECKNLGHIHPLRIANYMFASEAGHPFLKMVICAAINNVNKKVNTETDILNTTGPGLITDIFHQYILYSNDIILLENKNNWCIKECCTTPSCHFGDYATHVHFGSWRWQHLSSKPIMPLENAQNINMEELLMATIMIKNNHY